MKTIRALRQFSHYHAGHFDQFEERPVTDEIAEALISMDLAEYVEEPEARSTPAPEKATTKKPGNRK